MLWKKRFGDEFQPKQNIVHFIVVKKPPNIFTYSFYSFYNNRYYQQHDKLYYVHIELVVSQFVCVFVCISMCTHLSRIRGVSKNYLSLFSLSFLSLSLSLSRFFSLSILVCSLYIYIYIYIYIYPIPPRELDTTEGQFF